MSAHNHAENFSAAVSRRLPNGKQRETNDFPEQGMTMFFCRPPHPQDSPRRNRFSVTGPLCVTALLMCGAGLFAPARSGSGIAADEITADSIAAAGTAPVEVVADEAASAEAGAGRAVTVRVRLISGRVVSGRFHSLQSGQLRLSLSRADSSSSRKPLVLPLRQILRLDVTEQLPGMNQPATSGVVPFPRVCLANGDRLCVVPVKMDDDSLHVRWTHLPNRPVMKIPLLSVRGILFGRPEGRDRFQPAELLLQRQEADADLLLLKNGDRVTGRLQKMDTETLSLAEGNSTLQRSAVRAVIFNPRYVRPPRRPAERVVVRLAGGSLFTAETVVQKGNAELAAKTIFGTTLRFPLQALVSLEFLSPAVTPLSESKPAAYTHTPYLTGRKKLQRNRNVLGGPLRLRGKEYGIGLGMQSRSRVDYDLTGREKSFLAVVGVDDAAGGKGSVVFRVEVDGRTVFRSAVLTGRSAPLEIPPLHLEGHRRLSLIVDYGPYGDLLDFADWCDAVLVR